MDKVKVSVIIPAYNGDCYISDAINSILQQSYKDYEIIVVDDGSSDRTKEILNSYGDRIRYFSQKNQGVAAARNKGLEVAKGEYISFLDQDDYFLPDKLSLQVDLLDRQRDLAFVNSGWQIVNDRGEGITAVEPWYQLTTLNPSEIIIWKPVFLGAMLFRQDWLVRSNGFDIQLVQTPDVDLVMRLALLGGKGDWVSQVTVCYRQHSSNVSRNSIEQAQELETLLDKIFQQNKISSDIKQLENRSRYQSLVWSAWRLFYTGSLVEMANYLFKSLHHKEWNKTCIENIFHWLESFKNYSSEYGDRVDVYSLTNSPEWKKLIENILLKPEDNLIYR
jgi:glycosyltransferase involved in cell wall biosynthesis